MSVYNGEWYLREAIDSILAQTFRDFEFIIVNDGSVDNTQKVLNSYKDPRIVRLNNERNIGLVRSLNRGLRVARGEFIARMDADDASHPRRFEKQIEYLEAHPDVGVLGTYMEQIDETGRPLAPFQPPLSHGMIAWKMLFGCAIAHATVMMRSSLLGEVGSYNPLFKHIEDTELWSRLIHVTRFANLPARLYVRRWHQNCICNLHAETQYRVGAAIRRQLFETILKKEVGQDLVEWFSQSLVFRQPLSRFPAKQVIILLAELCDAFMQDRSLDPDVARAIRGDLSERVCRLIELCSNHNRISALWLFGHLLRRAPKVALSEVGGEAILRVLFGKRAFRIMRRIRRRFSFP
jgi:glycosyltransferase involved in cell wall biosynthesis